MPSRLSHTLFFADGTSLSRAPTRRAAQNLYASPTLITFIAFVIVPRFTGQAVR